jgi:hypothetical protein
MTKAGAAEPEDAKSAQLGDPGWDVVELVAAEVKFDEVA